MQCTNLVIVDLLSNFLNYFKTIIWTPNIFITFVASL